MNWELAFNIWFYSGITYSLYFLFVRSKDKDYLDTVNDLKWRLGYSEQEIFFVSFLTSFIGGIYYIPEFFIRLFTGKE